MDNNYLKIFDNLFFNVDENKDVKIIIEQACLLLSSLIIKFGEVENELIYGTSKQDNFVDTVIILFVRKIMEQLDAINVLFSASILSQIQIILRSLIENIISLEFILKDDTERRAAAYYLEHHYQEIELASEFFDTNSKHKEFMMKINGSEQYKEDCKKIKKKQDAFERVIKSNKTFQEIDQLRKKKLESKKSKNNKKVYISWYEVCSSINNFYGLMKETGYEKYYKGIYGGLSYETHALNSTTGMVVDNNGLSLKLIRSPENGGSTFSMACTFSISALHKIYTYLKDGKNEKKEFEKYFLEFKKNRNITCHNLDMIKTL